jgi:hypothetical protein
VACAVTAANVNETRLFQRLLLAATGVMKRIRDVCADKGTTTSGTAQPVARSARGGSFTSAGGRMVQGWAGSAGRSSARSVGCWRTRGSGYVTTDVHTSSAHCFRLDAYSGLWQRSPGNCENRLLGPPLSGSWPGWARRG